MASAEIIGLLAVLIVLQAEMAKSDALSPLLSPILDDVCKEVECGKGKCKPSPERIPFYVCDCDLGWKQTLSNHTDLLNFLPCTIPNCTVDYSCQEAPSPAPEKEIPANRSVFDPCYWTYCGGGTCNKTSTFIHKCECRDGYYNILNFTGFPCFKECAIGMDCANLGITMSNSSTSSNPALADNGCPFPSTNFHRLVYLLVFLTMVVWI